MVGFCCFMGIVLAELSLSEFPRVVAPYSAYLSPPIIVLSLLLMSYPSSYIETASWSTLLRDFAVKYFPEDVQFSLERAYGSLGGILLVAGIVISPHIRWTLSRPPLLWLGKVSFAIYLLHGTFLRTVFVWVLHLGQAKDTRTVIDPNTRGIIQIQRYALPGNIPRITATLALAVSVAAASHFWNLKFEPIFAIITNKLEGTVKGSPETSESKTNGTTILPLRRE
jgi:peptidoglycan/LPS O-acetylase OafA/YrhL